MMISWVYAYIQINQIVYIKYVQFLYTNFTLIKLLHTHTTHFSLGGSLHVFYLFHPIRGEKNGAPGEGTRQQENFSRLEELPVNMPTPTHLSLSYGLLFPVYISGYSVHICYREE